MALIMVLIFTILLYAMTAELVTTAQTARLTGENDVLIARMRSHMEYVLAQTEETLLADVASEEGAADPAAGLGGALGGAAPAAGGAAGGLPGGAPEEEPDPATIADGSQDAWFEPQGYPENDITTYVWVEDENRKFNILSLVSSDEEFARKSRERFVRLIDFLRDGTDDDVTRADAEGLADNLETWMKGRLRTEALPRPPLKSDDEERSEITLPLQLDELLLLPNVDDELFFDKVWEDEVLLGLESVLTVYTSLVFDPGDPDDPATQNRAQQPGAAGAAGAAGSAGAPAAGGQAPPGGEAAAGAGSSEEPSQPQGVGIRININTASRPVLRCLFSPSELPDSVIEAILRWRNEPVEEDPLNPSSSLPEDYFGGIRSGTEEKRKMFTDLAELDEIPEFKNIADPKIKDEFLLLVGVESDVFTLHMASLYKRNEDTRTYVLQRSRSVLVRVDEGDEPYLHPIVLHEERSGLRVMPVDFPEEDLLAKSSAFAEMDAFSEEERAWNPFYIDFFRPNEEREQMFNYRERMR
jgi:hypothetical protein